LAKALWRGFFFVFSITLPLSVANLFGIGVSGEEKKTYFFTKKGNSLLLVYLADKKQDSF